MFIYFKKNLNKKLCQSVINLYLVFLLLVVTQIKINKNGKW